MIAVWKKSSKMKKSLRQFLSFCTRSEAGQTYMCLPYPFRNSSRSEGNQCVSEASIYTFTQGITATKHTAEPYDTENIREDLYFHQAKKTYGADFTTSDSPWQQEREHHPTRTTDRQQNLRVYHRGHSVLESLTQYPARASFRDTSRSRTKTSVITKMATQLPMMRPR